MGPGLSPLEQGAHRPFIPREGPGLMSALSASPRTTATQGARNPGNRLFSDPPAPSPTRLPCRSQPRAPPHTSEGLSHRTMGLSAEPCQPGRTPASGWLGASHEHVGPAGPQGHQVGPSKVCGRFRTIPAPGGSSPSPAPATQPAPALCSLRGPAPRPPVCSLTDPVISRQHSTGSPGREGLHPNPDLHGWSIKAALPRPGRSLLPEARSPWPRGRAPWGPDRWAAPGGA